MATRRPRLADSPGLQRGHVSTESHQLSVEKLIVGGEALAHMPDGRVALVENALPGDLIRATRLVQHAGYVRVESYELITPSPERVEPACPVAKRCGGCDLMGLADDAQAASKLGMLREALRRTGGIHDLPEPIELVRAELRLDYRNRIRLQCDESGKVGFFSRASHELIEVPTCSVARPALREALASLREIAAGHPGGLSPFAHVELRISETADSIPGARWREHADARPSLFFVLRHESQATSKAWPALRAALEAVFSVAVGRPASAAQVRAQRDEGPLGDARSESAAALLDDSARPLQPYDLPFGVSMLVPIGGFVQVNWEVNQRLVRDLVEGAIERGLNSFVDLYCGAGNFSLPLLSRGLAGAGVELDPAAIAALKLSAELHHLQATEFRSADVGKWAKRWSDQSRRWDLVVVDPPRSGVKQGLEAMARLAERYLVMCSCSLATLARDLKRLLPLGFELEQLKAYDMFPQTHHVESIAWLKRTV